MGRSQETFNKKEAEKRKLQKRKEKEQRKEERKANARDGSNLDEMMAYVDENGNISNTPPDPNKKKTVIKEEDIMLGARKREPDDPSELIRTGKVTFFNNSKGFGFIRDLKSQESVFVHSSALTVSIKENDTVIFEIERGRGLKGPSAVRVKLKA
jgi:cold shock CspA family protein